ncbi:MAG: hypothetical protein IPG04_31450 [Polyangiaceae bacterium]|nr:hypothetical protein [Polyangiaceae bacterium]
MLNARTYSLAAALSLVLGGCFQDFEQFRPGQGGGGTGGAGGAGGADPCASIDCDDDNPCTEDVCDPDGNCLYTAATDPEVPQVANDCKTATCDGEEQIQVADPADVPLDDDNPCTDETCDGQNPAHPFLPEDTPCNDTGVCNATGLCSQCTIESQCGTDTTCADFSCTDNSCDVVYDVGLVISGENDGDCLAVQCVDGNPDPISAPFDDIENDNEECTTDTCDNGSPVHTPVGTGTGCDDGLFCTATDQCNASGACVGAGDPCSGGSECANACNEVANNCFDAAATPCGSNTDDACTNPDTCDGAGNCQVNHASNGTVCNDNVFCNGADQCNNGACTTHAGDPCVGGPACNNVCNENNDNCFVAASTACGDSSNTECTNPDTCNGSGTCSPNHEPASTPCGDSSNTECTNPDTCNGSGTCSSNHEADNTPCGDNTDTACTNPDTCQSGACASNHEPASTPCADGTFCDGAEICNGSGTCSEPGNPCTAGTPTCCEGTDTCVDTQADEQNCGACGTSCNLVNNGCGGGNDCDCLSGVCECNDDTDCPSGQTCGAVTANRCG